MNGSPTPGAKASTVYELVGHGFTFSGFTVFKCTQPLFPQHDHHAMRTLLILVTTIHRSALLYILDECTFQRIWCVTLTHNTIQAKQCNDSFDMYDSLSNRSIIQSIICDCHLAVKMETIKQRLVLT